MDDKENNTNSTMKWIGFGIVLLLVFIFVQKHDNTSENTITIISAPESEEKKNALKRAVKAKTGKDLEIITMGETPPSSDKRSSKQEPITPEDRRKLQDITSIETPQQLKNRLISYDRKLPHRLLNGLQKELEKSRFKDEKDFFSQLKNATKNKKVLGEISYQQCRNATHYDLTEVAHKHCQEALSYDPDNARFLVAMGILAHDSGKYQEAIAHYEKAVMVLTTAVDVDDSLVFDTKSYLAQALSAAGRYGEAIKIYNQYLAYRIQLSGKNHYTVASHYRLLGKTWRDAGDEKKAQTRC